MPLAPKRLRGTVADAVGWSSPGEGPLGRSGDVGCGVGRWPARRFAGFRVVPHRPTSFLGSYWVPVAAACSPAPALGGHAFVSAPHPSFVFASPFGGPLGNYGPSGPLPLAVMTRWACPFGQGRLLALRRHWCFQPRGARSPLCFCSPSCFGLLCGGAHVGSGAFGRAAGLVSSCGGAVRLFGGLMGFPVAHR